MFLEKTGTLFDSPTFPSTQLRPLRRRYINADYITQRGCRLASLGGALRRCAAAVDRQRAREEDLFLDMSSLVINHTINFASLASRSFSRRCVAGEAEQSMVTTIDGNREKMERMGEEGESPRRVG